MPNTPETDTHAVTVPSPRSRRASPGQLGIGVKRVWVVAVIGFTLLAGSCAGIDRDGSADELVRTLDVDKSTARCIIDGWIDSLGEDRVLDIERGAPPTAKEEQAIVGAVTTCSS